MLADSSLNGLKCSNCSAPWRASLLSTDSEHIKPIPRLRSIALHETGFAEFFTFTEEQNSEHENVPKY